jgi:hypothetical protein
VGVTATGAGDVDIGAKTAAAWSAFVERLGDALRSLPADSYLVLAMDATGRDAPSASRAQYYVQFAAEDDGSLVAEAVGNAHLPDVHRLDATAVDQMTSLGWQAPSDAHDGNFAREWPAPAATDDVARLAVRTLVEVFGAPHPAFLRYAAGRREDNAPVELPVLELARERDVGLAEEIPDGDLRAKVDWTTGQWLAVSDVKHDDDGDIPIRCGSAIVFVRVYDTPPVVEVFSPVVSGVTDTPDLLRRVNGLTAELPLVRFAVVKETLIASLQLLGDPFTPEHLHTALDLVGDVADKLDDELAREFGGRVFFGETLPERRDSGMVEGYL